jgi:hypothetical protein
MRDKLDCLMAREEKISISIVHVEEILSLDCCKFE